MSYSPILLLHIASGTLGMLSGFVAVFLKKGSRRHGIAGTVFVVTMLLLSSTGAYMGWLKSQPGNVLGGTLTFYLVATAWMTARRAERGTGIMDWGALAFVLVLTAFELTYATEAALSQSGMKYGYPPGPYVMLGSVGLFACIGDVRMLVRGGIAGTQRIARHLWRMCFALFVAAGSIFLARQHLFPDILQKTGALVFLSFLPLLLLVYWLVRIRLAKAYGTKLLAHLHVVSRAAAVRIQA